MSAINQAIAQYDLELSSEIAQISLDYNSITNKPQINSVTLQGNKNLNDLGIAAASDITITSVKIGDETLTPINKALTLPLATASRAGLVKSSSAENGIGINADGTMSVNSLEISKLYIANGNELVLDCGKSI